MNSFDEQLEKYAKLVVKVGVNLQPGQDLIVEAPLENISFARLIVKKAYEAGAKFVQVQWIDEWITRSRFECAQDESFDYYPEWYALMLERFVENGGALIHIKVPDPELYRGIPAEKVSRANKAMAIARKKYQQYARTHSFSWCLIKAPTQAWANTVFADLPEEKRVAAMWDSIFQFNRIHEEDPVTAWKQHIGRLKQVQQILNEKKYKRLHYKAPGTDVTVELPEEHVWLGGDESNARGNRFVANMPTEEVFTMPHRTGVNGKVTSTMPLNINGLLVDRFSFTFREGRIVDYSAEVGADHLAALLESDEGSRYLGEIALVPHDSPISNARRIFYNIGIDENASCHMAIGSSYPVNLKNGTKLSRDELLEKGGNTSLTHVDFMIGSAELDIDGELYNGEVEPIFRKGNWAIEALR
ncbi:aminopeptidase [Paenibacillus hexagrammi]|uniref:Aminopeptidase n=1 Tax=Paenibacillus hexagrammi TaxID=2908839 RepID=A0ABY3SK59_9BACL|nr:aminopeptidase [Paenibacillus sp. YPD9-1]UJF34418.1 aminopeptidase [Paenibacillus sp. YPD9-1]